MLINFQGFEHFLKHVNNQDYFYVTPRMLLVLDGCSSGKYSEVGTRLFTQLFSRKEENDSVEKFESNVKEVFDEIIKMMRKFYPDDASLENEFIMENLLFTIIACFECGDKFVVKMFGDGYIITQSVRNHLSYMKFSYGKCPPYFAYKYCNNLTPNPFKDHEFKTYEFSKAVFLNVGIASDGILPIVKGSAQMDVYIKNKDSIGFQVAIRMQNQAFSDDVTIAIFENQPELVLPREETKSLSKSDESLEEYESRMKEDRDLEKMLFGEEVIRRVANTKTSGVGLTGMIEIKPEDKSGDTSVGSKTSIPKEDLRKKTIQPAEKQENPSTETTKLENGENEVGGK